MSAGKWIKLIMDQAFISSKDRLLSQVSNKYYKFIKYLEKM